MCTVEVVGAEEKQSGGGAPRLHLISRVRGPQSDPHLGAWERRQKMCAGRAPPGSPSLPAMIGLKGKLNVRLVCGNMLLLLTHATLVHRQLGRTPRGVCQRAEEQGQQWLGHRRRRDRRRRAEGAPCVCLGSGVRQRR